MHVSVVVYFVCVLKTHSLLKNWWIKNLYLFMFFFPFIASLHLSHDGLWLCPGAEVYHHRYTNQHAWLAQRLHLPGALPGQLVPQVQSETTWTQHCPSAAVWSTSSGGTLAVLVLRLRWKPYIWCVKDVSTLIVVCTCGHLLNSCIGWMC